MWHQKSLVRLLLLFCGSILVFEISVTLSLPMEDSATNKQKDSNTKGWDHLYRQSRDSSNLNNQFMNHVVDSWHRDEEEGTDDINVPVRSASENSGENSGDGGSATILAHGSGDKPDVPLEQPDLPNDENYVVKEEPSPGPKKGLEHSNTTINASRDNGTNISPDTFNGTAALSRDQYNRTTNVALDRANETDINAPQGSNSTSNGSRDQSNIYAWHAQRNDSSTFNGTTKSKGASTNRDIIRFLESSHSVNKTAPGLRVDTSLILKGQRLEPARNISNYEVSFWRAAQPQNDFLSRRQYIPGATAKVYAGSIGPMNGIQTARSSIQPNMQTNGMVKFARPGTAYYTSNSQPGISQRQHFATFGGDRNGMYKSTGWSSYQTQPRNVVSPSSYRLSTTGWPPNSYRNLLRSYQRQYARDRIPYQAQAKPYVSNSYGNSLRYQTTNQNPGSRLSYQTQPKPYTSSYGTSLRSYQNGQYTGNRVPYQTQEKPYSYTQSRLPMYAPIPSRFGKQSARKQPLLNSLSRTMIPQQRSDVMQPNLNTINRAQALSAAGNGLVQDQFEDGILEAKDMDYQNNPAKPNSIAQLPNNAISTSKGIYSPAGRMGFTYSGNVKPGAGGLSGNPTGKFSKNQAVGVYKAAIYLADLLKNESSRLDSISSSGDMGDFHDDISAGSDRGSGSIADDLLFSDNDILRSHGGSGSEPIFNDVGSGELGDRRPSIKGESEADLPVVSTEQTQKLLGDETQQGSGELGQITGTQQLGDQTASAQELSEQTASTQQLNNQAAITQQFSDQAASNTASQQLTNPASQQLTSQPENTASASVTADQTANMASVQQLNYQTTADNSAQQLVAPSTGDNSVQMPALNDMSAATLTQNYAAQPAEQNYQSAPSTQPSEQAANFVMNDQALNEPQQPLSYTTTQNQDAYSSQQQAPQETSYNVDSGNPGTFRKIICQGGSDTITCPSNQRINILNANYGDMGQSSCYAKPSAATENSCQIPGVYESVKSNCDDMEDCQLSANDQLFGDECKSNKKYLDVSYNCMPNDQDAVIPWEKLVPYHSNPALYREQIENFHDPFITLREETPKPRKPHHRKPREKAHAKANGFGNLPQPFYGPPPPFYGPPPFGFFPGAAAQVPSYGQAAYQPQQQTTQYMYPPQEPAAPVYPPQQPAAPMYPPQQPAAPVYSPSMQAPYQSYQSSQLPAHAQNPGLPNLMSSLLSAQAPQQSQCGACNSCNQCQTASYCNQCPSCQSMTCDNRPRPLPGNMQPLWQLWSEKTADFNQMKMSGLVFSGITKYLKQKAAEKAAEKAKEKAEQNASGSGSASGEGEADDEEDYKRSHVPHQNPDKPVKPVVHKDSNVAMQANAPVKPVAKTSAKKVAKDTQKSEPTSVKAS